MAKCVVIAPKEACKIEFGEGKYSHSKDVGMTVRNESLIADYDENGKIIRIEILGSKEAPKPCQETTADRGQKW